MSLINAMRAAGIACLVLLGLASSLVAGSSAAETPSRPATQPSLPVQVELKVSSSRLKPGEACVAEVVVRNASSSEVLVKGGKGAPDVQMQCWRDGHRVVIGEGRYMPEGDKIELKPGESATAKLDLTAMYSLRTSGRYLVAATVQFSTAELAGEKEQDRVWVPSFKTTANFVVGD